MPPMEDLSWITAWRATTWQSFSRYELKTKGKGDNSTFKKTFQR